MYVAPTLRDARTRRLEVVHRHLPMKMILLHTAVMDQLCPVESPRIINQAVVTVVGQPQVQRSSSLTR